MKAKNKILGIKEAPAIKKEQFNPLTSEYVWKVQKKGASACFFDGFMVIQMIDRFTFAKIQNGDRHAEYQDYTFDFIGKNK